MITLKDKSVLFASKYQDCQPRRHFGGFSANDFDLKISKPPGVLVLANNDKGQNINSAFFAVLLMRIIRLVNTPENNPCTIVVDETPTLYLHKVENLIATARSNKVALVPGLKEIPQFYQQYCKETANSITSIMGTIISGAVRSKEPLDWLEILFGKIKQTSTGINIDRTKTGTNLNEKMDTLIQASKIANQNTGEVEGLVSRDNQDSYGSYETNSFKCKVILDLAAIETEKQQYCELPKLYDFGDDAEKKLFLLNHLKKIYEEVKLI